VRVFEEFAIVDLISGGRAEIMAGRGSFTESFPLFGYDLADYEELFEERPNCSPSCSRAGPSAGRARPARPCSARTWCRTWRARSRRGSASAATRSR
jgi:hypothetical protein